MNVLIYLVKMIAVSGMLYGYYWLFLRNRQFHHYNRLFLLGIPALAVCLPLFHISVNNAAQTGGIRLLRVVAFGSWEKVVTITAGKPAMFQLPGMPYLLLFAYVFIVCALLLAFVRAVAGVFHLTRKYNCEKIDGIRFFKTSEPGTPFSFLNNIFWNDRIETGSPEGRQILRHEMYHVRHKHSADIIFIDLASALCWLNPFFHLLKKEIRAIHEFLADQDAVSGSNKYDYAELLLRNSMQIKSSALVNPFFHNQLKRRIMMITRFKNSSYAYLTKIMVLPLLLLLFCAFATKFNTKNSAANARANHHVVVVIDAGHGGSDMGTVAKSGEQEKNIALSVAKKIAALSKNYNVSVIMTRDADILPGNAASIIDGMRNRVGIAEKSNAKVFVSIHINGTENNPETTSGFSAFLSSRNAHYPECVKLGSALQESIRKSAPISDVLQETKIHVRVLEATTMPSIIIECGYITNQGDLAFITDEKNQEKIAGDILEGIVNYVNNKVIADEPLNMIGDTIVPKKDQQANEVALEKVEIESEYPGGSTGWSRYLQTNLKYPAKAVKKEIQGTVLAQFIVNTDGSLQDVKILRSPDQMLSDETLRIIKNSGKWIPAQQNGKAVRSYKKQPIIFKLQA